jgi:hypothetical protein
VRRDEWALVFQSAVFLVVFRLGLYFFRFESLQEWATSEKKIKQSIPISKLIWAAMMGARLMPNATCLVRALAASRLLARNGYKSTLYIGVKRTDGLFEAHAWVEYEGYAIIGSQDASSFTRLCCWENQP